MKTVKEIFDMIPKFEATSVERMYTVALDAGHYLMTEGKCTPPYMEPANLPEWWLNNRIVERIEAILGAIPQIATVRCDDPTGQSETSLEKRCKTSDDVYADLFVSVHHNLGIKGGYGGGITAFSFPGSEAGAEWRDEFYTALIDATGLSGNRKSPRQEANYYVLRCTNAPAVLLELGFMDSRTDLPIIYKEEYAEKCAKAICAVIIKRFGIEEPFDNNAAPAQAEETVYNSIDELPSWAREDVQALIDAGILRGVSDKELILDIHESDLKSCVRDGRLLKAFYERG